MRADPPSRFAFRRGKRQGPHIGAHDKSVPEVELVAILNVPGTLEYGVVEGRAVARPHVGACRYLLAEDLKHGQEVAGVRIVNPFLARPDAVS